MAFKGSASPVKGGMKDQTSSNVARDGSAKRTQTKFPVKDGMKNSQAFAAAPGASGNGPDADPADGMTLTGGSRKIVATAFKTSWGNKDANGNSVNGEIGKKVLAEGQM